MIVLPPLCAPKIHLVTHDCIEIANNKTSTASSGCRCRRGRRCCCCCCCRSGFSCSCSCRCRRRNVAVNERGAFLVAGKVVEQSGVIGLRHRIECYESSAVLELAVNENIA